MIINLFVGISFGVGLALASFVGNIAYRGSFKSVVKGRSKCEKCDRKLSCIYLIPVLGYIFSKGKCPKCKYKIPWYYPVSELLLGIFFAVVFYYHTDIANDSLYELLHPYSYLLSDGFLIVTNLLFGIALYYFAVYDLIHMEIPATIVQYVSIAGILVLSLRIYEQGILFFAGNIFLILGLWLMFKFVNRNPDKQYVGEGDMYFLIMTLLCVPWSFVLSAIWMASFLGGLVSVVTMIKYPKKWKSIKVPYIPILVLGFLISYIFGFNGYIINLVDMLILNK